MIRIKCILCHNYKKIKRSIKLLPRFMFLLKDLNWGNCEFSILNYFLSYIFYMFLFLIWQEFVRVGMECFFNYKPNPPTSLKWKFAFSIIVSCNYIIFIRISKKKFKEVIECSFYTFSALELVKRYFQ